MEVPPEEACQNDRVPASILEGGAGFVKAGAKILQSCHRMESFVEKSAAILRKNGWCGILIKHNGVVFALSVIADAMPPLPRGEAIAALGQALESLQLYAC